MKTRSLPLAARVALRALVSALLFATFAAVAPRPSSAQPPDTTWVMRNRFEDLAGACNTRGWTAEERSGTVYAHVSDRWVTNTPFMTGLRGLNDRVEFTGNALTSKLGTVRGTAEGDSGTVLFIDRDAADTPTLYQAYSNGVLRAYATFTNVEAPRFVARDPVSGGAIVSISDGLKRVPPGGGSATRIAGGGGFGGDTTALAASFLDVEGIAVDASGVIYFADRGRHRVSKLRLDNRVVTVAGNNLEGTSGDGGPATSASLSSPSSLGLDLATSQLTILCDGSGATFPFTLRTVRFVNLATNIIDRLQVPNTFAPIFLTSTPQGVIVGNGFQIERWTPGDMQVLSAGHNDYFTASANQNLLSEQRLASPSYLSATSDGGFLFTASNLVLRVSPAGVVTRVAGNALPVQMGARAFWFGADSTSASGEVKNWVRNYGYGNGWSQRLESPALSYSSDAAVFLTFDAVVEIGNADSLESETVNQGLFIDGLQSNGVWRKLDFKTTNNTYGSVTTNRANGRDVFHVIADVGGGTNGIAEYTKLRIRMQSDYQNSDEDAGQVSTMGGLLIDNLAVTIEGAPAFPTATFEDGTTNGWTTSAFNGFYAVGGLNPYYTLDFDHPTTQVALQSGFDPTDPSCVWKFTGTSGYVEPGTFARITSPWIATGDSSQSVIFDWSGKLSVQWSGYATQLVVRVKAPGQGSRPAGVFQPFGTFENAAAVSDPLVPFFPSVGPIQYPNDFDVAENTPFADSVQFVLNVVDVRMNYPATIGLPPNPGPTRFPYFDDMRIAQVNADPDRDGVPNRKDQCPSVSAAGEDADGNGCLDATASLHHVETWMLDDRPIHYAISLEASPQITDNSDLFAIHSAFATWTAVDGANLPVIEDPATTQKNASAFDGINLVTFQDPDVAFAPGVLAVTPTLSLTTQGTWDDQPVLPGQILDADMILNPLASFSTPSHAGSYDLQSVATHEAGHLLGLSHSPVQDATMFFVIQPGIGAQTLSADDEAAIAAAYPAASLGTTYGAITGHIVRGANGHPIGGAAVTAHLLNAQGNPVGPEISDYTRADGSYALRRLAPGDYGVRVDPIDGSQGGLTADRINEKVQGIVETNFQPEWYSVPEDTADDPDAKQAITIGAGQTQSAIDIITNVDIVPPTITAVSPADAASAVRIDALVTVGFSEPIASNTIPNAFHLRVQGSSTDLPGSGQVLNGTQFVFAPETPLAFGTTYDLIVSTQLTDDEGVHLASDFTSSFTTEPQPALAITNIIPTTAVNGQLITIEGAGFVGDDTLRQVSFFFPPEASAVLVDANVLSPTQLVVRVPGGATSGGVTLYFSGVSQGFRSSNSFGITITTPPPQAAPIPSGNPVALDFEPSDLVMAPDGTRAFAVGAGGFVSVDLAGTRTPVKHSLAAADAIALTPDGKRAAVVRNTAGTLEIRNTDPSSGGFGGLVHSITTTAPPRAVALSMNGKRAHVVVGTDHVDEIDIDPTSATAWQTLRSRHLIASGSLRPLITMDPRGTQLYVADQDKILRVPLSPPDTLPPTTDLVPGAAGGIAVSADGRELFAASYPNSGRWVGQGLDVDGNPAAGTAILLAAGLSTRDAAFAHEGQSGFLVDETLNQLLVVNMIRSDASFQQVIGTITTGQTPVAVATASLASVIGVANKTGRSLSFYTYGGSGLELTSVVPPAAYPGDQVAVAGASNLWSSGTQADLGGTLHPTSFAAGSAAAFQVPSLPAQATTVTLQAAGGARSYARAFSVVDPVASFTPALTPIVPQQSEVTCFSDSGIGLPRTALLSPDGRTLAVYGENPMGCIRVRLFRAAGSVGDSLGKELKTLTYTFGITGMAWTPDSRQLWISFGSHGGFRVDADPNSPTFGISLGNLGFNQPGPVAMDPLGRWMYVREMFPDSLDGLGTGLISLTSSAKLGKFYDVDGPMISSPDGRWLVCRVYSVTQMLIHDLSNLAAPPITTTDRSASGAGELVAVRTTSDGRRAVGLFGNGYIQVVNLDPAAGAVGTEVWFGQPLGPGQLNDITCGTTPSSVLISRGTTLARVDVANPPPTVVSVTLPNPAEIMAASSDGRRLWTGRHFLAGPGGGSPGVNTTVVEMLTLTDASSLSLLSGSGQQALTNHVLPTPVRVKVRQANGNAEPGVVVRFTAPSGTSLPQSSGSATIDRVTDAVGEAEVTWQMGSAAGSFAMNAQVLGTAIPAVQATAQATLDDASIEPVIVQFGPVNGTSGLSSATPVFVRFNQKMQISTVADAFQLTANLTPVSGTFSTSDGGYTVLFQPSHPLPYSAACVITVLDGPLDTDNQSLATGGTASFTVQAPPTLSLTAISPPAGTVGTPVVIQGRGLSATPASNLVLFNGTLAPVVTADPTAVQTDVPLAATSGDVTVQVGPSTSNALAFTVLDPNPVPGTIIGSIPSNKGIRAIQVTPDGSRAYVTNPSNNEVAAINIAGGTVITRIPVGVTPQGIGILPDGRRAYVANTGSDNVSVIDIDPSSASYNKVVNTINVGDQPIGVAIAPQGPKVVIHNIGSSTISVIDADAENATYDQVVTTTSTGSSGKSGGVTTTQDGGLAWVVGVGGVVNVDIKGDQTTLITTKSEVADLTITPNQSLVLALLENGDLIVIDALPGSNTYNQVVTTTSTGSSGKSGGVSVTQDGGLAYVTDGAGNTVFVFRISTSTGSGLQANVARTAGAKPAAGAKPSSIAPGPAVTLTLLTTLTAGAGASGIDFDPNNKFGVIANTGDGTISIIGVPTSLPPIGCTFGFNPNSLNLKSMGKWVKGTITPPSPWLASQIDITSLRLEGVIAVDPEAPHSIDGNTLTVRFDRNALTLLLPEGDAVPVHLTGTIGTRLLTGVDAIKVKRAPVTNPHAGTWSLPGSTINVTWQIPNGTARQQVAIIWTRDKGASWDLISTSEANDGSYAWHTPTGTSYDSLRVGVVIIDSGDPTGDFEGVLGVSDYFALASGPVDVEAAPATLQFAPLAPNPARGVVSMRFGLPRATHVSLDVFDLQGRRVKRLIDGDRPAGWHQATWKGDNAGGRHTGAGIYFVQFRAEDRVIEQRLVRIE